MKRYSQQQISDLLDKFMNGLSTPEEEAELGDYFRTHDVPEEWEDYRLMFDYFDRGMEGELLSPKTPVHLLTRRMERRWWALSAAAAIAAVIVSLTVFHRPASTTQGEPTIVKNETVDTPVVNTPPVVEMQQLAVTRPPQPATHATSVPTRTRTHRLRIQNDSLRAQNERLQHELEDLKRRAFIIDMEANGFKAVMGEDGRIVFIDMEQVIENEFNQQTTNNIPEI